MVGEGSLARQELEQDARRESKRRPGRRPFAGRRRMPRICSGAMYGSVPPARARSASFASCGQVEVEQHRLAVVGDQDVGRLDVPVHDAALVGMGQGVGQPLADPQDGIDVGSCLKKCERRR